MREHDARTLPAAALALVACAIAARTGAWWYVAAALGAAGAVLVGLAWALRRAARRSRQGGAPRTSVRPVATALAAAGVAALLAAVLAASGAARAAAWLPAPVRDATASGGEVTLWGTVASDPEPAGRDPWTGEERQAVTVRLSAACAAPCETGSRARGTAGLVGGWGEPPSLGEAVRATGRASPSRDPRVSVTLWDARVETLAAPNAGWGALASVRASTRSAASGLPDGVRGLTLGMVMGDTSAMPADLVEQMRITGLTHLTAVSGSHFAIVTLALGAALRRAVRVRWVRSALLGASMAALAAFVGPEPSVLRALTMALALAAGIAWGRPSRALSALGVGVLALLAIEPKLAASAGLQLSAVAVLAIVAWAPRLRALGSRWLPGPVAGAVAVPLAAWLACWPLLVTLKPGIGVYTVPANLVAAVAAFPVTLIGLAGAVASLAWPAGGAWLLQVAGACAWPVVAAARSFSRAPAAWLPWPSGAGGAALACAVVAALVVGTTVRGLRGVVRLGVALAAVAIAIASPVIDARLHAVPANAAIVVCDVGQGDMMLVRTEGDAAVVIDTGPPGGAGADCLRRYGIRHVSLLVLTHPHADHDGAVGELAAVATIDVVWASPAAFSPGHEAGARDARAAGAQVLSPPQGTHWAADGVSLRVLYPPPGVAGASTSEQINDASIALLVDAHGVTALALGDLETEGQDAVAALLRPGVVVDLVKVAHHGSATQSARLASLVTARVAAVSVGADNSYGHPADATLALYAARASLVLTTARCGDIVLTLENEVAASCRADMAG